MLNIAMGCMVSHARRARALLVLAALVALHEAVDECSFRKDQCTYNVRLEAPERCRGRGASGTLESQNDYAKMSTMVKDFRDVRDDHEKRLKELENQMSRKLGSVLLPGSIQMVRTPGPESPGGSRLISQLQSEFQVLRNSVRAKSDALRRTSRELNDSRAVLENTQADLIAASRQLMVAEEKLAALQEDRYIVLNRLKEKTARLDRATKKLNETERRNAVVEVQLLELIRSESNLKEELGFYQRKAEDMERALNKSVRRYQILGEDYARAIGELRLRERQLIECHKAKTQTFCGFEDPNSCGFSHSNESDFEWKRIRSHTPSTKTGPSQDHTCRSVYGYYMYLEASAKSKGKKAILMSPLYRGMEEQCVEFYYHMYGKHMGTLNVHTKTIGGNLLSSVWRAYGNQGNLWIRAQLAIPENLGREGYQIVFEGITEGGYQGDMAIDDIMVTDGPCAVGTKTVAVPDINPKTTLLQKIKRRQLKKKKQRLSRARDKLRQRSSRKKTAT